jgi:hypothetical protein
VANNASRTYNIENPLLQLEQILKEAPQSALLMLWDEERTDEMERVANQFLDDEIAVYELTDALTPMGWDDSEPAEPVEATVTNIRPEPVRCGDVHSAPRANSEDRIDTWSCDLEQGHDGRHKSLKSDGSTSRTWANEEADEQSGEQVYSRTDLKEMSMLRLKEVAATLSLPPRKSREQMVSDILAAQSGEEEAVPQEPEPAEEPMVPAVVGVTMEAIGITEGIEEVLDRFSNTFVARMSDVFDSFLTDLGKTIEGVQFNLTPEPPMPSVVETPEPEPEPEQPRRRLRRG